MDEPGQGGTVSGAGGEGRYVPLYRSGEVLERCSASPGPWQPLGDPAGP